MSCITDIYVCMHCADASSLCTCLEIFVFVFLFFKCIRLRSWDVLPIVFFFFNPIVSLHRTWFLSGWVKVKS